MIEKLFFDTKQDHRENVVIKMSEALYLCFWSVMLLVKGLGLYDGQGIYKIFLVLSFLFIAAKMCITEYSRKEWFVILVLALISAVIYRISGEKGILICMITIVAMKNVSVKRAFRVGLVVWSMAMGVRFLYSLAFIDNVQVAVQTKNLTGAVLRYYMGYPHPNVLHISYLVLVAFIIYCLKDSYNWKHFLLLAAGNLFMFLYSYSFTGTLIVMAYICLSYYVRIRKLSKIEYFLIEMLFPVCVLFSIVAPVVLQGRAFALADKIFNNRINFAKHFLTLEYMSLLGNNLAEITTDIITMDNAFVFVLVIYGIPVFLLMCAGYILTVRRYVKLRKDIELVMICCFIVAGITEPFLFNTSFKNLTLLFLGSELCGWLEKHPEEKTRALLKNKDKDIFIPAKWFEGAKEKLLMPISIHKKVILRGSFLAAILSAFIAGICYRARESVLEIQKENLLVFERIRVIVTTFTLVFIIAGLMIGTGYLIAGHKGKQARSE